MLKGYHSLYGTVSIRDENKYEVKEAYKRGNYICTLRDAQLHQYCQRLKKGLIKIKNANLLYETLNRYTVHNVEIPINEIKIYKKNTSKVFSNNEMF